MTRTLLFAFVLVGLVSIVGCSDKQPLGGTITFSDDGTPVPCGAIFFETPTFVAQGTIKPNGTYEVGSTGLKDGIPKGTYSVSIRGAEDVTTVNGPNGMQTERRKALIDRKYQTPENSGLTFTVDGKTRKFDIQVDRAK